MQRYFSNQMTNNTFIFSKADSHHMLNVMRLSINNQIEVIYKETLYNCNIINIDNKIVTANIQNKIIPASIDFKVTIAQALVTEQKMDYILQKSTELGVNKIIPLTTERSIIKNNIDSKKIIRWNKIVTEASSQSKRLNIPIINNILSINDLIKLDYDLKILCSVNEKEYTIKNILNNIINKSILIVIGPEGGFTEVEETILINNNFQRVSLGNNVLRTETASLYVLSIINYKYMQ